MITFWFTIVILIFLGLAFVLLPLLRSNTQESISREEINKAIYHGKVADLEADLDKGLLDKDEYDNALADLQKVLLQDAQAVDVKQESSAGSNRLVTLVLAVSLPVLAILLYKQVSTGQFTNDVSQQQAAATQPQSLESAVTTLEQKLKENPDSVEGWKMLGQSYFVMQRYDDAKQAYIEALDLVNHADPELLVLTAESSAYSNDELFADYEKSLLTKALSINPKHERALWYSGYAAYASSEYANAVKHWEVLLSLVPQDRPQVKDSLLKFLGDAREKAGIPSVVNISESEDLNGDEKSARTINVSVQLNASINEQANSTDTLFIYARPAQGPKMPLSLSRMTVASLPVNVTLTKDMSMMPNMTIDSFDKVEVLARISKSGQAITQQGDLISQAVVVDFSVSNSADISLDINSVVE